MSNTTKSERVNFTSTFGGKQVNLTIGEISNQIRREAEVEAGIVFKNAIQEGLMLNAEVDNLVRDRKLINEGRIEDLSKSIRQKEKELLTGKVGSKKLTKLEGRAIALSISKIRQEINTLADAASDLYSMTAERRADQERLQYFIYASILNADTQARFFPTYSDFKDNLNEDVVRDATVAFGKRAIGRNYEAELPENKWLIKYKFMNDKLELVNEAGQLVDEDFRLINAEGHYIDQNGRRTDRFGNLLDNDGALLVEDMIDAYTE